MTTIKEIFDSLSDNDRRVLTYAFNNELCQHILLPNGAFIGVNMQPTKTLQINNVVGKWSTGTIKKGIQ